MPQIQEYLPQTTAQEPVGGSSPNIELAGAVGRSISNLGSSIEEGSRLIEQRTSQEEQADIYAQMADKRQEYMARVQQGVQDGTLDTEQIRQDFENDTQAIGDNISTPQGRNFFERQQARSKGAIMSHAMYGQAQLASKKQVFAIQQAIGASTKIIERDPTQFQNEYEAGLENIDSAIEAGAPEALRDKFVKALGNELSSAEVRGRANSIDANDPNAPKYFENLRGAIRGDKDTPGAWDKWVDDADQKQKLINEVTSVENGKNAEKSRLKKVTDDAQDKSYQAWDRNFGLKLAEDQATPDMVQSALRQGLIDTAGAARYNKMILDHANGDYKDDPHTRAYLTRRIVDQNSATPINNLQDLQQFVASPDGHGISIDTYNKLSKLFLDTTPQGQREKRGMRLLDQQIKAAAMFKNGITGQYDPSGYSNANQAWDDYFTAKDAMIKAGKNPDDLLNPSSPDYFGSPENLQKYQTPLDQQMVIQKQDRGNKALNLPTSKNPQPDGKPNPKARLPNESPADYIKRMRSQAGN